MRAGRLRRRIAQASLLAAITALLFLLVEGVSSLLLAVQDSRPARSESEPYYYAVAPERRHARYDAELGWVSIPGLYLPDLYGPGRYLRTEARGFRNDQPVTDQVPEGRARVVCSGDSFTFGQGVANDRTWCHRLALGDDRLEAVNMGQRGYGVDQAFLWYMRDGRSLEHQIHVFAFIGGDFVRMRERRHKGYGKPVLGLEDGELVVRNVPVPPVETPGLWWWVGDFARELRSVQVGQRLLARARPLLERQTRAVALEIFRTLRQVNQEKGSVLVLLYLPVEKELRGEASRWRGWLDSAAAEHGLLFIDLTPEMSGVAPAIAGGFFIGTGAGDYVDAAGHYSERGHQWVAETLYRRLMESGEVRAVLGAR